MIFVDTSAWFAAAISADPNHSNAAAFLQQIPSSRLITSDFVLDETLTLFKVRRAYDFGIVLGRKIIAGAACSLIRISERDFADAFDAFVQYRDKGWSFTDCTSLVLMRRLGIGQAFAFDQHFHQFGSVQILPLSNQQTAPQ